VVVPENRLPNNSSGSKSSTNPRPSLFPFRSSIPLKNGPLKVEDGVDEAKLLENEEEGLEAPERVLLKSANLIKLF